MERESTTAGWICVAAVLALAPSALSADEHELSQHLTGAVLDWCDRQGGYFRLPHISAPSCETGEVVYLGTLKGVFGAAMAPDAAWWWKLRTGLPDDLTLGVLWYVGPNDPKELPDYVQSSGWDRGFPGSRPPGSAGFQPADGRRPAVVHAGNDARDPRNAVVPT